MATITPELRREIEKSGDRPVRIEDPQTHAKYVIVREELYERMRSLLDVEHPSEAYPAVDRSFTEDWDDPKMEDYDRYEQHRP